MQFNQNILFHQNVLPIYQFFKKKLNLFAQFIQNLQILLFKEKVRKILMREFWAVMKTVIKKNYSNLTNLLDSQVEVELTLTQKHSWGFLHFTTQRDPYAG